jgi:hypothetical protein
MIQKSSLDENCPLSKALMTDISPVEKAMVNTLDLTAYLDRVNWRGPTERTYATLAGLLDAH